MTGKLALAMFVLAAFGFICLALAGPRGPRGYSGSKPARPVRAPRGRGANVNRPAATDDRRESMDDGQR